MNPESIQDYRDYLVTHGDVAPFDALVAEMERCRAGWSAAINLADHDMRRMLDDLAETRARYQEQCELTQEMRANAEVYRRERDEARSVLAQTTDCLNAEMRQEGPLDAPQVERFMDPGSLCNGIRFLGDRLVQRKRERGEAREFAEEAARKYNALIARGPVLTCAFCGFEYAAGTPASGHAALTAHVMECEKHPLAADRKRMDRLEAEEYREQCWRDAGFPSSSPRSMFRENLPITRARIDEALANEREA